jgi:hypothetical protein
MAKLVRAKFKTEEYLPKEVLCCAAQAAKYDQHKNEVFEADLETIHIAPSGCRYCGKKFGNLRFVGLMKYERPIWIDCLDLDEGGANA